MSSNWKRNVFDGDGQRVSVALTVSPIRDGEGKIVSGSVTGRDITERKLVEEELRRSEARFRQMADLARDGEARLAAILDTAADAIITSDRSRHDPVGQRRRRTDVRLRRFRNDR